MGTSSSYKGSSSASWKNARDRFNEVDSNSGENADVSSTANAIGNALSNDLPIKTSISFSISSLSARGGSGGGGGGGGSGAGGSSERQNGRAGSRSVRQPLRGAARGATAIRAAFDLLSGNRAELDKLGLNLDELQSLGAQEQCARIVDVIIGDANHPDDAALKRAVIEHLKNILLPDETPSIEDTVKSFVGEWIFQLALVELRAESNQEAVNAADIRQKENKLKDWLRVSMRQISFPDAENLSAQKLANATAKLTTQAIALLKAMK